MVTTGTTQDACVGRFYAAVLVLGLGLAGMVSRHRTQDNWPSEGPLKWFRFGFVGFSPLFALAGVVMLVLAILECF